MSIVALADLKLFLDIPATDNSKDDEIDIFHNAVEAWFKEYTGLDFESTTYTNEEYDGSGTKYLALKKYPIISVARVAVSRDEAIKIKNTSTDATTASVVVDGTNVTLTVSGGANDSTTTLAKATYATMTTLVDAVNAAGKGWSAAVYDTDYASYKTANLLEQIVTCTSWDGVTADWEYLYMAGEPVSDFAIMSKEGMLYRSVSWSEGVRNIIVTYTAGYVTASMPADVKLAIMAGVKFLYQKRNEETVGVSEFSLGTLRVKYEDWLPAQTLMIANKYAKIVI